MLDGSKAEVSRLEGVLFGVLGLVFFWLGIRLFRSVVLLLTDEGTREYARTFEPIIARSAEESLRGQGLPGMKITTTYTKPTVRHLVLGKGKLHFDLRGVSILQMRGRNR